jgi:predicted SnoaL-like aldol condensation-catalyzing enzyme
VVGEGDIVLTHGLIKTSSEDPGTVAADFFRLEDGKIVEHWDVLQPFPETSANTTRCSDDQPALSLVGTQKTGHSLPLR